MSHNIGQLIVAMIVVETYQVGYYLPVLLIAGVLTGFVIGIISGEVLKRIQQIDLTPDRSRKEQTKNRKKEE